MPVFLHALRNGLVADDVGDDDPTVVLEDAPHFVEDPRLVRREIHDAVRGDQVHRAGFYRDLLEESLDDRLVWIGLVYVVPIAVGMRWFPDHKGLITGLEGGVGGGTHFWRREHVEREIEPAGCRDHAHAGQRVDDEAQAPAAFQAALSRSSTPDV